MYHFLSGYTARVAGTEKGLGASPEATFSTCFGAPFLPRRPEVYGKMLEALIQRHGADCWLVNTGWSGGQYGVGKRMSIRHTRALLRAALDGSLATRQFPHGPVLRPGDPGARAGRAGRGARSAAVLGGQGGVRPDGARTGRQLREEFPGIRGGRRDEVRAVALRAAA